MRMLWGLKENGACLGHSFLPALLQASVQFSSVAQSCPTLCDSVNCSTPGLPVHHQLPEFTQTHVHRISDAIQPSHPLLSPSPPALSLSQHQGFIQWVSASHQVAKNIGVSVSISLFPMNTQDWYPLGWTCWISLQSKGFSRVVSNTTVQKYQFFGSQLFYSPTLNPYLTTGKTIPLTRQTFHAKEMSLLFIFNTNVFILMGG